MIQDIFPYKYNVEYKSCLPEDSDRIILISDTSVLVRITGEIIEYPKWEQIRDYDGIVTKYLFSLADPETESGQSVSGKCEKFFFAWKGGSEAAKEVLQNRGYEFVTQRNIQYYKPQRFAFAGTTAFQLAYWYVQNQFCGKCGRPMMESDNERMVYCDKCKIPVYPRINPVVIVGVINGDRILLTKYARGQYRKYALVAGFVEAGETLEEAVSREVHEETGLRVRNIRYYKSQPWSLSSSLIAGMFCDLDGPEETTLADGELSVAEWVHRDDVPVYEDSVSITTEMIWQFKKGNV